MILPFKSCLIFLHFTTSPILVPLTTPEALLVTLLCLIIPSSSSEIFCSIKVPKSKHRKGMILHACENFVEPMPIIEFLSEFIPEATQTQPENKITLDHLSVSQNEDASVGHSGSNGVSMLTPIQIRAIKESGLCPRLKFINTTSRKDSSYPLKPDITIYSGYPSDESGSQRFLDWKTVDLWVVNKNSNDGIFHDLTETKIEDERDDDLESGINSPYDICDHHQLLSYASALGHSQFRIFSFAVVLFGDTGRLLRWDHSGVIYS